MGEERLGGGISHAGEVRRDGDHVLRPAGPHTPAVHAYLRALRDAGFDGCPEPIGIGADGRERLTFVPGAVPTTPYPAWVRTDEALASVARLLRRLHDVAATFDPSGHTWDPALADPAGGSLVVHGDVEPSNVVFRDGVAVALIDFDLAAPGRPVYDLAHLARLWVPVDDEVDRWRVGWSDEGDQAARLRIVADAYGLDGEGRDALIGAIDDAVDRIEDAVRRAVEAGHPGATALWRATGGAERFARRRRWWAAHRAALADALRG